MTDPLVKKICMRMLDRSNDGIIKYGNTMRTAQKPLIDWITELLDAVVYLEKIKEKMSQ